MFRDRDDLHFLLPRHAQLLEPGVRDGLGKGGEHLHGAGRVQELVAFEEEEGYQQGLRMRRVEIVGCHFRWNRGAAVGREFLNLYWICVIGSRLLLALLAKLCSLSSSRVSSAFPEQVRQESTDRTEVVG